MIIRGQRKSISERLIINDRVEYKPSLYSLTKLVTSTEILSMDTIPVVIIPAVTGRFIIPTKFTLDLRFNTQIYQTTPTMHLKAENSTNIVMSVIDSLFLSSNLDAKYIDLVPTQSALMYTDVDSNIVENDNVVLTAPNTITNGDSDFLITIEYYLA